MVHEDVFEISTVINGEPVFVTCCETTARVLLPIWAAREPNLTVCREAHNDQRVIVAFL